MEFIYIHARIRDYDGKVTVEYSESERKFTVYKDQDTKITRQLFGLFAAVIAKSLSNSKELLSFTAEDVEKVKFSRTKRKVSYYIYTVGSKTPFELTDDAQSRFDITFKKAFADKLIEIT